MTNFEKVKELTKKGLKAKQIIEKTGLGESTVYTYMSRARQEIEESGNEKLPKNKTDHASEHKEMYHKLEAEYEKLGKERQKLDKANNRLTNTLKATTTELNELKERYADVVKRNEVLTDRNERLNSTAEELAKKTEVLESKKQELQSRNDELIDEARAELNAIKERYKTEKAKHETLFSYVTLRNGVAQHE